MSDFSKITFNSVLLSCDSQTQNVQQNQSSEAYATLQIKPYPDILTNLKGKADTGAMGNLLPLRVFRQMFPKCLDSNGHPTNTQSSNVKLIAYNDTVIPQFGTLKIPCSYKNSPWQDVIFFVADSTNPVLFGLPTCISFGILSLNCAVETHLNKQQDNALNLVSEQKLCLPIENFQKLKECYPDLFTGLGKFQREQKLVLKDNCTPVRHPPRRAPIQLRDKICKELDRMIELDVIRSVESQLIGSLLSRTFRKKTKRFVFVLIPKTSTMH